MAKEIIQKEYKLGSRWIVYCEDKIQMNVVLESIRALDIDAYVYYSDMPGDKEETLQRFEMDGGVLVSIRCLDEGVDIPATTHALILASSKNPREFIQRRGRILRKADKKYFAQLYDVLVVPNMKSSESDKSTNIVLSELSRAIEFGQYAKNKSCTAELKLLAIENNVNYREVAEGGYENEEQSE